MRDTENPGIPEQDIVSSQEKEQLAKIFSAMEYPVSLILFSDSKVDNVFVQAARMVIREVRNVAPLVSLKEFGLDHELAKKYNVTFAPTLLFGPEEYNIRWLGAPVGEEGRTFVEALLMLGTKKLRLSDPSRKVLDKIDSPRNIKLFVSPTCPYCPQQAVNALMAAAYSPQKISLEIIDIQANMFMAEKYSAHSVPVAFANEKLIARGAQPEELFMASLEKLEEQTFFIPDSDTEEVKADLVIIGGGPAGLTAGIYSSRSGLNTVVIEKGALGGQVATTPMVENYPGLARVPGKTLVDIMVTHALEYVTIFPSEEVMDIQPGKEIVVLTSRRRFKARAVLIATGAKYRRLSVPGEERYGGRGVSYCSTCDGPLFQGKKVLMVGGGNSALTEALHLQNIGVDVTLVHRRDSFRAQENLIQKVNAANIPAIFNTEVVEIRGNGMVEEVEIRNNNTDTVSTISANGVFVAIGYEPTVDIARKIGADITPDGFVWRDERHRTSVRGIYSAGDVEGGYKQIVTAAGQGAEAALSIFEDMVNPYWMKETQGSKK